jgi:hypothetical protein
MRRFRDRLKDAVAALITQDDISVDRAGEERTQVARPLADYLIASGASAEAVGQRVDDFGFALASLRRNTQYLCWIEASEGDVVNLEVKYSTADTWRSLPGYPATERRSIPPLDWRGIRRDTSKALGPEIVQWLSQAWTTSRMGVYRTFGAAPLNYVFQMAGNRHASSYYFSVSPPAKSSVAALTSDIDGLHTDQGGIDSARVSFHIHNEPSTAAAAPEAALRAYLRADRRDHKMIAAGALINLIFVYLVARGRFVNGLGTQTWLLVTPTLLTGFIAQQQRHYYAAATRRQRAVLWVYLLVAAAFLIVAAFSKSYVVPGNGHWGVLAKVVFLLFGFASTFVAVIYASLGPLFLSLTRRTMKKQRGRKGLHTWTGEGASDDYEKIALNYCDFAFVLAALAALAVLAIGIYMWVSSDFRATQIQTLLVR